MAAEHAPLNQFRAVAPDGDTREAATDDAVRQAAGRMFQRHIRPIALQRWTPETQWEEYDHVSTADWWKTTGRRDTPLKDDHA